MQHSQCIRIAQCPVVLHNDVLPPSSHVAYFEGSIAQWCMTDQSLAYARVTGTNAFTGPLVTWHLKH